MSLGFQKRSRSVTRETHHPMAASRTALVRFMLPGVVVVLSTLGWGIPFAEAGRRQSLVVECWDFNTPQEAAGWRIGKDLKDLRVVDGRLCMEITGPDAYLYSPPIEVPLDGLMVRVRLRGDRDGDTQVYWTTNVEPSDAESRQRTERTLAHPDAPGSVDRFNTVEFVVGEAVDVGRKLTRLRIDPYNNNASGHVEIDYVMLVRLPPVWDVGFAAVEYQASVGEPVTLRATCRQCSGVARDQAFEVTFPGAPARQVAVPPTRECAATTAVRFDLPGVHTVRATAKPASGVPVFDLETSVIVGREATLPLIEGLRTARLRLDLVPAPDGKNIAAARWQVADEAGRFRQAGWLLPLAEITAEADNGRIVRRQPLLTVRSCLPESVRLEGAVAMGGDWHVEVDVQAVVKADKPIVEVTARLTGPENGRLLDFAGPILRCDRDGSGSDPLNRFGIFGGLEFLEPGWRSSSERAVGERFADRWAPHPYKITVPVMAVEAEGLTTALMWQPLAAWDGTEAMPTATFASPNFLDRQSSHLMKLSVPTIPRWRSENKALARQAYVTHSDRPLKLDYCLFAEPSLPVALTARVWYEVFGTPTPPTGPHDDRATYEVFARNLGETLYWPEEKGWRHHWFLETRSRFSNWMAAELLAHAAETQQDRWVDRTGLRGRTVIDTAGPLARRLYNESGVRAALSAMRPDGTWAFANPPRLRELTRKMTNGRYDSLGEDGSSSLGTCVTQALPILQYALLTGREEYGRASRRALNAMRQFRVPRGAQVWEVHKDIPDIRAAALAVEAYHLGYQITGDRDYLDEAHYWAWSGAPFLYSWHVPVEAMPGLVMADVDRNRRQISPHPMARAFENPDRQVTPFGSVPVLGPTQYVCNWFGVIVQWCGLEWAWKVIELDRDRPDPLLRYIADGVVLSGRQQMFDRPPWVGLYPDVWDTQTNQAKGALICCKLPLYCMQAQHRLPCWSRPWTRVLRNSAAGSRWHVSGWGKPIELAESTRTRPWEATVEYLPGEPTELVAVGVNEPRRVRVEGETIEPWSHRDVKATKPGWRYDPALRAVILRFVQPKRRATIRID